MNGQQTSDAASFCGEFQEQAAPVAEVACWKVYLVYSEQATRSNEFFGIVTVKTPDGSLEQIPFTKVYHPHNWSNWQDLCRWKDAKHIATVDEAMVMGYTSTQGMPAEKMPNPGNVSPMFRPK